MSGLETSSYHSFTALSGNKAPVAPTKLALVPTTVVAKPAAQTTAARGMLVSITWMVEHLLNWHDRRRQRLQLARMDDYMLRDIGLSQADVSQETSKPFWRP